MNAAALESKVREMTDLTNAKNVNVTGADFVPYAHETITHLGAPLTRDAWAAGAAQAYAAVPGSMYYLDSVQADEKEQKVICAVIYKSAKGKELFKEEFTYTFEEGKIKETSSASSHEEVSEKFKKAVADAANE